VTWRLHISVAAHSAARLHGSTNGALYKRYGLSHKLGKVDGLGTKVPNLCGEQDVYILNMAHLAGRGELPALIKHCIKKTVCFWY